LHIAQTSSYQALGATKLTVFTVRSTSPCDTEFTAAGRGSTLHYTFSYSAIIILSVMPCSLTVVYRRFRRASFLCHHSSDSYTVMEKRGCYNSVSPYEVTSKMAAIFMRFSELQKVYVNFIMSVCPSVRMKQHGYHWMDFHEIICLSVFRKSVEKILV
jgi:hypothetical protein